MTDDDTPEPGVGDVLATASALDENEDPEAGDAEVRPPEAGSPSDVANGHTELAEGDPNVH